MDPAAAIPLQNGLEIPALGLGVFRTGRAGQTETAVRWALQIGYRHVDTAKVYRNEHEVGAAISGSDLPRESVFVTTKLWREDGGYDQARRAFDASLQALGLDYVDLYLMHWPLQERRIETWRAMERLVEEGRCRAIGVSNFTLRHLRGLLDECEIPPAINQIELHPFLQQRETVDFCRSHGIVVEAWAPLTKAQRLDDPTLVQVAREIARTPAQVLIRWSLQKGFVCLPKSGDRERIRQNAEVFDFELSDAQLARLDALEEGYRTAPGWDPTHAP